MIIYLDGKLLSRSSGNNPEGQRATSTLPYSALLQMGFTKPSQLPDCWCALTAPFHPYRLRGGFLFYGTFPGVAPAGRYPASCPAKLGLSSDLAARDHLSCSRIAVYHGEMGNSTIIYRRRYHVQSDLR